MKPTININVIQGGIKTNVVPDSCEAQVDMYTVKDQDPDSLIKAMNALMSMRFILYYV